MAEKHILLVDDDVIATCALREHLSLQGYKVSVAGGCEEGREALRAGIPIHLVILDFLMADGRGTDLLISIADDSTLQKPPVLMSSGTIDPASAAWQTMIQRLPPMARTLIRGYVNKPFTFEQMDQAIDAAMAQADPRSSQEIQSGDYLPSKPDKPAKRSEASAKES